MSWQQIWPADAYFHFAPRPGESVDKMDAALMDGTIMVITCLSKDLQPETIFGLKNKSLVIYYWGHIEYDDVFGKTWISEYRYVVDDINSGKALLWETGNGIKPKEAKKKNALFEWLKAPFL
jgi:hypothetical protein